ncbi:MAG: NADPH-dependent glutamate synthase [Thermodesulfovibrionales bacterium]|nr:NADPH-dependent glutamate synthase [Thermodesulfovibrionales bacterium]
MAGLTPKDRMAIKRHEMPVQDPHLRINNFNEVALGYDENTAKMEAERCLQCKTPQCVNGCPVGVRIPQFIKALREGNLTLAVKEMKVKNNLPAICGRVCPQETQCEGMCVLSKKSKPVAIGRLERFIGDYELTHRTCPLEKAPQTGKKIAVVGSGPAGLTCAVDLGREGHEVTIFESLHVAGGVLVYGIPEFRLPKKVVHLEIDYAMECLGIKFKTDYVIGRTLTIKDLLNEFDAIFIGSGAGLPMFLKIPGIDLNGVMSANEFLTRVNLMMGYLFPEYDTPVKIGKKVAVIGAGNVAMDAARCSLRFQKIVSDGNNDSEVHIVYRRSRQEVPARAEEVHHAEEEGIIFDFLTNPVEIIGNEKGQVKAMRCVKMELGEPDSSGRRKPIPIKGSEFDIDVDTVIVALGTSPNPLVFVDAEGLQRSRHGTVVADAITGKTTVDRIWAGGDVVTGAATVISAMGAGKRSAEDINKFLNKGS